MKSVITVLLILILNSFHSQVYDNYRVRVHSNPFYLGNDTTLTEVISISNTITVDKPVTLYIPTVFSPDGDGINDLFYIFGNYHYKGEGINGLSFEIYNRWGQIVFQTEDLKEGWNGIFRNKPSPIGTYVYQLKLNRLIAKSGTVTLVR